MTVKITIQTMSTKCQYSPINSTFRASFGSFNLPATDSPASDSNRTIPAVPCAPRNPVRTQKALLAGLLPS